MNYQLRHLVIKPTLLCTANCPTCGTRKILHNSLRGEKILEFSDWVDVLYDAKRLGVERLDISGGEPTLCKYLDEIIDIGKKYNWYININTNGSMIGKDKAEKLVKSGLNNVYVSLYSFNSKKHDSMRGRTGLWKQAVQTIRIFANLQNRNFTIKTL